MKQDVINLCIDQASATIREVNDSFLAFVRELGGAEHLPKKFSLNVPTMQAIEDEIDEATAAGDLVRTEELCDEYRTRFAAYLERWREQIKRKVAA